MKVVFRYPLPGSKGKACLSKADAKLDKQQLAFDADHFFTKGLPSLGYRSVSRTGKGNLFDLIAKSVRSGEPMTVFDVHVADTSVVPFNKIKTSMSKALLKKKKLWAAKKGYSAKTVLAVIDDVGGLSLYEGDGLGVFSPNKMLKFFHSKNWKKELGHGSSTPRLAKGVRVKSEKKLFKLKKNQKLYEQFLAEHKGMSAKELAAIIENDLPDVSNALDLWLTDSEFTEAVALKIKAGRMEVGRASLRVPSSFTKTDLKNAMRSADAMSDLEYIKFRSLTQAYYKSQRKKQIVLYRGIDGDIGEELADRVRGLKPSDSVRIKGNSVSSYSSREVVANKFGKKNDGITIRREVDVSDILLDDDLWIRIKSRGYQNENEYLILNPKELPSIPVKDIFVKGK